MRTGRVAAAVLAAAAWRATASGADPVEVTYPAGGRLRAAFVTLGADPRPAAMGSAFTAVADDASAVTWNPGGLGQVPGKTAGASWATLGDGIGLSNLTAAWPTELGVFGAGVQALLFGSYTARDALGQPTGTPTETDVDVTIAYAAPNADLVALPGWTGFSFETLKEAGSATLNAFGAGGLLPLGEGWQAGWSVRHLGVRADDAGLPATATLGLAWSPDPAIRAAVDGGASFRDRQPLAAVGVEAEPVPAMLVRLGYGWRGRADLPGTTGFAAGLGWRLGSFGLDYAYEPFGDFVTVHRFALTYRQPPPPAPGT